MDVSWDYKFIFLFKKEQPEKIKIQEVFFCLLTVGGDMIQQLVFSGLTHSLLEILPKNAF